MFIGALLTFAGIGWLFYFAAHPAGAIVWSSGEVVTLALAGALVISAIGLAVLRERGGTNGPAASGGTEFDHDRQLPSAA